VLAWVAANLSVIPAAAADLCRSDNDGHLIHSVTWRRRMTGARRTCSDKPQPHDIWFVLAHPKKCYCHGLFCRRCRVMTAFPNFTVKWKRNLQQPMHVNIRLWSVTVYCWHVHSETVYHCCSLFLMVNKYTYVFFQFLLLQIYPALNHCVGCFYCTDKKSKFGDSDGNAISCWVYRHLCVQKVHWGQRAVTERKSLFFLKTGSAKRLLKWQTNLHALL